MDRRTFLFSTTSIVASSIFSLPALAASGSGKFSGFGGHKARGTATVKGNKIILENDFWFDGAPDPRIGLGKGGKYIRGTEFVSLKKNSGQQTYTIPYSLRGKDFDTVILWCRKFSVLLARAPIR